MASEKTLFCFGYGYSAAEFGRRARGRGWRVVGTTRSPAKAAALKAEGVDAVVIDDAAAVRAAVADATHLLISAGPDAERAPPHDPTLADFGAEIAARAGALAWIGYLSTTGVYGDHQGGWVDETAERSPATARGRLRVAAEDAWLDLWRAHSAPAHLFRLAGIYGPGRGPFAKLRSGTARRIVKEGQVFSRIHVEDIARAVEASIAAPAPGEAYNVCDDDPAPPQDVIAYGAEILGLPVPPAIPFEEAKAQMSPMAVSFYAESKRVSNHKLKALGWRPQYPSYRDGLSALLTAEGAP